MDDKSQLCSSESKLLIDFNSPVKPKFYEVPLVPSPVHSPGKIVSTINTNNDFDEENNPFDLVVYQTNINVRMLNDPFELVYQKAFCSSEDTSLCIENKLSSSDATNIIIKEAKIESSTLDNGKSSDKLQENTRSQHRKELTRNIGVDIEVSAINDSEDSIICIEDISDPMDVKCLSFSDNSDIFKHVSNIQNSTNVKNVDQNRQSEPSQCYTNIDKDIILFSPTTDIRNNSKPHTDEELKAMVANRINVCIQNALEQSKIPLKENELCHHNSLPRILLTPEKSSTHNYSHVLQYSPELPTVFHNELCQKRNSFTPNLKLSLGRPRASTNGTGSSCSSYGELNKAFLFSNGSSSSPIGNNYVRRSLSSSLCLGSSKDNKEQESENDGDDSVFLEAHALAFVFTHIADSICQNSSDEGEVDLLNSKPQWEETNLELPKFSGEDDDKTTQPVEDIIDYKTEAVQSDHSALSNTTEQQSIKDNKIGNVVPNVLPTPLALMDENIGKDVRMKVKKNQQIEKRGPLKAVVPLYNMTRSYESDKKGMDVETALYKTPVTNPCQNKTRSSVQETNSINTQCMSSKFSKRKSLDSAVQIVNSQRGEKKGNSLNRSLTLSSPSSSAPCLRRSNSLTKDVPSLVSPAVTLVTCCDKTSLPATPNQKESKRQVAAFGSQQKSKSSVTQFNVSGLAVTSTPTRKVKCATSSSSVQRGLPSPIPRMEAKKESTLNNSLCNSIRDEDNLPKNRSFDESQQTRKGMLIPKEHPRSRSASSIQRKRESQVSGNSIKSRLQVSYKNGSGFKKENSQSPDVQKGILKPLIIKNINGQKVTTKEKTDHTSLNAGTCLKKKTIQKVVPKLKSALVPVDKENVKPL
ncbi:uncharacterized protein [Periplaneta americana]|uniref:uncharacterized protein isoform X2 n=1 Tax=Periplaneta americana TaxID=6978 RepID=UPI0037E7B629